MQLTRIDRWLLESFAQETHVYTLRPATNVPHGVREVALPDMPGRRFQHHYIASDPKAADHLIAGLRNDGMTFSTQVTDREAWYVPLIAPKGKSITWRIVWSIIMVISLGYGGMFVKGLWDNPTVRENVREAAKLLKN